MATKNLTDLMSMNKSDIQEYIWDLRAAQANCSASERSIYQDAIVKAQKVLDLG